MAVSALVAWARTGSVWGVPGEVDHAGMSPQPGHMPGHLRLGGVGWIPHHGGAQGPQRAGAALRGILPGHLLKGRGVGDQTGGRGEQAYSRRGHPREQ